MSNKLLLASAAALAVLSLSGCITLLPQQPPPPRMFVLDASDDVAALGARLDVVVGVGAPGGARALLGSDIAWRRGGEVAFVKGAQWSGRADDALQTLIVQTLSRQGGLRAAVRTGEARSDYDLRWDLVDFEIVEEAGVMRALFRADVKVLRTASREVLGERMIEAEAPLAERSETLAADALTRAAREGSARISAFALETMNSAQSSAASISR